MIDFFLFSNDTITINTLAFTLCKVSWFSLIPLVGTALDSSCFGAVCSSAEVMEAGRPHRPEAVGVVEHGSGLWVEYGFEGFLEMGCRAWSLLAGRVVPVDP